jgi:hypothetical protein
MMLSYAKQVEADLVRDLYLTEKVGHARVRRLDYVSLVRDDGGETVNANFHEFSPFSVHPEDDVVHHASCFPLASVECANTSYAARIWDCPGEPC